MKKIILTLLAFTVITVPVFAGEYEIDSAHSQIGFSVKHMMVSNVRGQFKKFDGKFVFDEKKTELTAGEAVIEAKSIDTGNDKRDIHLRDGDFLDVAKFPTMKFVLKSAKIKGKNRVEVQGDFTMKGVTKPVTLKGEYMGTQKGPKGNIIGFSVSGVINRKDFGVTYNKALETGGVAIGEEITVTIDIEASQKK